MLYAATFSNSYVKCCLRFAMLRFVAVPLNPRRWEGPTLIFSFSLVDCCDLYEWRAGEKDAGDAGQVPPAPPGAGVHQRLLLVHPREVQADCGTIYYNYIDTKVCVSIPLKQ
jgi:hypothetical protein